MKMWTEIIVPSSKSVVVPIPLTVDDGAYPPEKARSTDAAWDIRAREGVTSKGNAIASVSTGLHVYIPLGWYGQLLTRSSMAARGLVVIGGVIDAGYTGEIIVMLGNVGPVTRVVNAGDKIAQLVILPVPTVMWKQTEALEQTERGADGFGSTGA